jgi:HEAT repeat protein
LSDEDADVRWQAAVALRHTEVDVSANEALSSLRDDPHPAVRAELEEALVTR